MQANNLPTKDATKSKSVYSKATIVKSTDGTDWLLLQLMYAKLALANLNLRIRYYETSCTPTICT